MSDQRVRAACAASFEAHLHDCSGFARAVSTQMNVILEGSADDIVDTLREGGDRSPVADGVEAAASANAGRLVIAGLKGAEQANPDPHGHVVVIVSGPLAHGAYPTAWWGSLGGSPGKDLTLNWAGRRRIATTSPTRHAIWGLEGGLAA